MSTTTTQTFTTQRALDEANPNKLADAIRQIQLGTMLAAGVKQAITQSAAATVPLDPPALCPAVISARVTGGAAAAGPRRITDVGGTPSATLATLSDDGATLTFEDTVSSVVVSYIARPAVEMTDAFEDLPTR